MAKSLNTKCKGQNLALVVEPANFLHEMSSPVDKKRTALVVDNVKPGPVVHVDQLCQVKDSNALKLASKAEMDELVTENKDDANPHGKLQFCLPTMDDMACFQECETGIDDDDFIDLEDGPEVA